jgi:hypothetical protein
MAMRLNSLAQLPAHILALNPQLRDVPSIPPVLDEHATGQHRTSLRDRASRPKSKGRLIAGGRVPHGSDFLVSFRDKLNKTEFTS